MTAFLLMALVCLSLEHAALASWPASSVLQGLSEDRLFFADAGEDNAYGYGNGQELSGPTPEYVNRMRREWSLCDFYCESSEVRVFRCRTSGRVPLTEWYGGGCCVPSSSGTKCSRNSRKIICSKEHTWKTTKKGCRPSRPVAKCALVIGGLGKRYIDSKKKVCFNKFWSSNALDRVPLMKVGQCCRRCHRGRWTERECKERRGR